MRSGRERLLHRRADRARTLAFRPIAGAPDKVPAHHTATHRVAERMAARATAHLDAHEPRALARRSARLADRRSAPASAGHTVPAPGAPGGSLHEHDGERRQAGLRRRTVRAGRSRTYAVRPGVTGAVPQQPPAGTAPAHRHLRAPHAQGPPLGPVRTRARRHRAPDPGAARRPPGAAGRRDGGRPIGWSDISPAAWPAEPRGRRGFEMITTSDQKVT
ncbi:hypothetical protein ACFSUJ_35490 [Streptomyces lusitanus]|uniref:hypothetical protein n=1 Tax=Streptomyces lusitanus TaxID=68232 RepID=UPI0036398470